MRVHPCTALIITNEEGAAHPKPFAWRAVQIPKLAGHPRHDCVRQSHARVSLSWAQLLPPTVSLLGGLSTGPSAGLPLCCREMLLGCSESVRSLPQTDGFTPSTAATVGLPLCTTCLRYEQRRDSELQPVMLTQQLCLALCCSPPLNLSLQPCTPVPFCWTRRPGSVGRAQEHAADDADMHASIAGGHCMRVDGAAGGGHAEESRPSRSAEATEQLGTRTIVACVPTF